MAETHPWRRYVAMGDSFTEGIGDPEPGSPGGNRGWADRVAEVLSQQVEDFSYANLAVRGKLIQQIADEQLEAALALKPDLITLSGGGNDVIRPGTDPDRIAEKLDALVGRLAETGATVVVFTGVDTAFTPVLSRMRGKIAIYNENIRKVAQRHGALVADQWALTELQDARMWDRDRLHMGPLGHHTVARMVLATLGVENSLQPMRPEPLPPRTWRKARTEDLVWAREYFVPWVIRRIRRVSSGDHVLPKRPEAVPYRGEEHHTAL
ncbi:SGNH/GDSL hydrolase family protein [Naasia aerilata]|uniref:SGNH hydrolase n=1 Tax=Naasia aerilata TaxID=1162966 RepID=A0ABM8GFI6_9MICO|nr:SGNH/GDSL hydrolase family protein [Naasia aerilata]BDZ47072.1 SGNH hydrolase [Naasia aerilata]